MTPPIWLDATGRPRPTQACWTCGREVAPMRFRAEHLRPHGWAPPQTLFIPNWCGEHERMTRVANEADQRSGSDWAAAPALLARACRTGAARSIEESMHKEAQT